MQHWTAPLTAESLTHQYGAVIGASPALMPSNVHHVAEGIAKGHRGEVISGPDAESVLSAGPGSWKPDEQPPLPAGAVEERADAGPDTAPGDGMETCPLCDGDGTIRAGNLTCPTCTGKGQVPISPGQMNCSPAGAELRAMLPGTGPQPMPRGVTLTEMRRL